MESKSFLGECELLVVLTGLLLWLGELSPDKLRCPGLRLTLSKAEAAEAEMGEVAGVLEATLEVAVVV